MIDLSTENVFPIAEAPRHIPGRPALATVWRWVLSGCGGIKLDSLLVGGRRFTSQEAIQRFVEARTSQADETPAPARTSRQRQRDIDRAEAELAKAGI